MRKQMVLVALALCVVAVTAASVAFAAPSDPQTTVDAPIDDPHPMRPDAASGEVTPSLLYVPMEELVRFQAEADARLFELLGHFGEQEAAAAAQVAGVSVARTTASGGTDSGPGGVFACIRARESGGDYSISSSNGMYHGAYQFLPSTWNSIAASSGRGDLVGVNPASASPADQDAMAAALYAQQGAAPWGGSC